MATKYIACVLLLMSATIVSGQGFRSYPWGADKNTILNKDTLKPDGDTKFNTFLLYRSVSVSGDLYADASYNFDESKHLISGSYWFGYRLSEQDWNRLLKVLSEKYGKVIQTDNLSKPRPLINYHWQSKDTHIIASSERFYQGYDRNIMYYSTQEWSRIRKEIELKKKNKPVSDKQGL